MRMHIGVFGRRNVGKSSLLNAITRQRTSIVSEQAGTTTDPVEKPMELLPLGPVLFIDTAGIDDDQEALGTLRVERTRQVFDRTDLGVLVCEAGCWGRFEDQILDEFQARRTPFVVVFNKVDQHEGALPVPERLAALGVTPVPASLDRGQGVAELRLALLEATPAEFLEEVPIVGSLVPPGGLAVLVIPIDKEAPRGRVILPQVQVLRDLLDAGATSVVVRESELQAALGRLQSPPDLVVTDSQAFAQVAAMVPPEIPLTGFSVLFARYKGDLVEQAAGAAAIGRLKPGSRVLIAEACTHHPIADDIGTTKIPNLLRRKVGGELQIDHVQGRDFPRDPSGYELVINCGACMLNRRAMLQRIASCRRAGVPITNYGMAIAYTLGIFDRALAPFPGLLEELKARA
jgi:[FeFe] hydrogenase H-cluster maturation GTPase HydF